MNAVDEPVASRDAGSQRSSGRFGMNPSSQASRHLLIGIPLTGL